MTEAVNKEENNYLKEEDVVIEKNKKPLTHAKLSALSKARSEKLLKQQTQNYKEEMTMTTLNNIYEKLNLIETKLFTIGKRTNLDEQQFEPKQKKQKSDQEPDKSSVEPRSFITYLPTVGLFIASSLLTRYATNQLREFFNERFNTTTDRENIGWGWMQNGLH